MLKQRSISLPKEYWKKLEECADNLGISVSEMVRSLIRDWRKEAGE